MATLHQFPYFEVDFDKNGRQLNALPALPAAVTDVFVISHGWNNDKPEARALYSSLFKNVRALLDQRPPSDRSYAVVGVFWPSQKFFAKVAAELDDESGPAVGKKARKSDAASLAAVRKKLDAFGALLSATKLPAKGAAKTSKSIQSKIDALKRLLPKLDTEATAREKFVEQLKALVDPAGQEEKDDGSAQFFSHDSGDELMKRLRLTGGALAKTGGDSSPATAIIPGKKKKTDPAGETAGLFDKLKGFAASAANLLNYVTYYQMKARAGLVGKEGVAPLVDHVAQSAARVHLIGHSFGGRVVTAAAASSTTKRIQSLALLQAAFSHNGFSKARKGFFRAVIDDGRVKGPIFITHTANDKAVGIAYPIASRLNGDKTAALGDENDEFGGMGRNGAQKMNAGEVDAKEKRLRPSPEAYTFATRIFNLKADPFIADHGDVENIHVANAIVAAIQA